MSKKGFTLIEMLVVISIIMLTVGFGFVNFFNFRSRQLVENTAREIVVFLRQAQNNAKLGDRGEGGGCTKNPTAIAEKTGNYKLDSWQVDLSANQIEAKAICGSANSNPKVYSLPEGVTLSPSGKINFSSLFGRTSLTGIANDQIRISDGQYSFQFFLEAGGAISDVCACTNLSCNGADLTNRCNN